MKFGHVELTMQAVDAVLYENVDGKMVSRKLPFKLRYKLAKIREVLQKDFDFCEDERLKLVNQYGDTVELEGGGSRVEVVDEEKKVLFFEALKEVLATDVASEFTPLTEEDLQPIDNMNIDLSDNQLRAFVSFVMGQYTEDPKKDDTPQAVEK